MAVGVFAVSRGANASFYNPEYPIKASDFSLVRYDGIFHIFYTVNCFEANAICDDTTIGHATSPDLTNWTRQPNVLENGAGFDADEMWAPDVIQSNGTYYMFYVGVDYNGTAYVQKIGLARSNDLINWEKDPRSPIVNCDTFSWAYWDEGAAWRADCRDPSVFWDAPNNRWVMTVSGRPTADPTRMIIGLATSTDLVNWTELGTVASTQTYSTKAESSSVIYRDGSYLLLWSAVAGGVYATSTSLTSGFTDVTAIASVGFATEIRQIDGLWVFAEVYHPELHFQELLWGSGVSFTVGELPYGSLSGKVFRDADGDGAYDSGETGIGSVTVQLYTSDGDSIFEPSRADFLVDTKTSSASGDYSFATVLPEAFWLMIPTASEAAGQPLASLKRTSGITTGSYFGNPRAQTVARSTSYTAQHFGFVASGAISGTLWNDADRDGVEDSGEGGFNAVSVNLTGTEGTGRSVFRQAMTTSAGAFSFSGLLPGTYSVTVSDLTGVLSASQYTSASREDQTVDTTNIALSDGEAHTTADFGYAALAASSAGALAPPLTPPPAGGEVLGARAVAQEIPVALGPGPFGGGWPHVNVPTALLTDHSLGGPAPRTFPGWALGIVSFFAGLLFWNAIERRQRVPAIADPGML